MRRRGFQLAVAELMQPVHPPPIVNAEVFSRDAGYSACLRLLDAHPSTTAIVAANDLLALGCYDALKERNIRCPQDISITGYNDAPFIDMVSPPLTTVRIKQREMGIEAARLVLARMNGQEQTADILLRPELIERQSTAALRESRAG
jgi:LacI family transcriptional regulator